MLRIIVNLVIGLALFTNSFSQASLQLLSSAGEESKLGTIQLSWSLGEPVSETFKSGNFILSQGFQQVENKSNDAIVTVAGQVDLVLTPNPANDYTLLKANNHNLTRVNYLVADASGRVLVVGQGMLPELKINLTLLSSGIYIIKVFSSNKSDIKTFKLIKL